MESIIYCSTIFAGTYEDKYSCVVYVGLDYELAIKACNNLDLFTYGYNSETDGSYIDYWQNGKYVKTEGIMWPKNE